MVNHARILAFAATGFLSLAATSTAAAVTAPASPITIGFATISNLSINGVPGTVATVPMGSSVTITATVDDSHPGYCPGCIDFVPIGLVGSNAAGCLENYGHDGTEQTNSVTLSAPPKPGPNNVGARADYVYYCDQYWGDGTQNTPIATLIVTDTTAQLAAEIASLSSDPSVTAGLSDKLAAYQAAVNRGDKNASKIMAAFNNQLQAQTGKAFTADQVATIKLWQQYLA